jgi:hypothetical protein
LLALAGVQEASAQSVPATAEVEARASLVAPQTPITLTGGRDLSFGEIAVPNGRNPGAVCQYDYRADTFAGSLVVAEIRADGSIDFGNPSNCEARGAPRLARFDVECDPGIPVFFDLTFAATRAGVSFAHSPGFTTGLSENGAASFYANWNGVGTHELACTAAGALDVHVGGLVRLSDTAEAGADISIGTITLEASY